MRFAPLIPASILLLAPDVLLAQTPSAVSQMAHARVKLAEQIAVPPDGPGRGPRFRADVFAGGVPQTAGAAPRFRSTMARVNVRHHSLSYIYARVVAPNWLAGTRLVNAHARRLKSNGVFLVLGDEEQLQTGAVGIEITEVHRIAMSPAG